MRAVTEDWNASAYRRFEAERSRPAADLLARVPTGARRGIVDLGCGPGNSTQLLAERYPESEIVGLDASPDMLVSARARLPRLTFTQGDIADWRGGPADLIFAQRRSALGSRSHRGHGAPCAAVDAARLPGRADARQRRRADPRPDARDRRRTALPRQAGARGGAGARRSARLPIMTRRFRRFATRSTCGARSTSIASTGPDAIVAWVESTGLRPFLAPLMSEERAAFLARYRAAVAGAYPPRAGGGVLLPFPRLFIVASRRVETREGD